MTKYIWDTGALSLVYAKHKDATRYYRDILNSKHRGLVPDLVLSEFFYKTWSKFGEQAALVSTMNYENEILEVVTHSEGDIYDIGDLKVKYSQLSMIDRLLIVLAKKFGATILTTDQPIKDSRECKVINFDY